MTDQMSLSLGRRTAAEFVGTAFLLMAIVGSGIMAERLSGGNVAVALLANSVAIGGALVALILTFGPLSGAHFNPIVTFSELFFGGIDRRSAAAYLLAQLSGAFVGTGCANLMFESPIFTISQKNRTGFAQFFAELIATFGFLTAIFVCKRWRKDHVPLVVASYIVAAIWFTSSTSFANPAVTIARTVTDTFTGIRPADAPQFLIAELVGAAAAISFAKWLNQSKKI